MADNGRDIHEMDQILDKEALDIGWKEYQNIIWKESGNFLERYSELRDVPYGIASGTIVYRSALQWEPPTTEGKSAENLEEVSKEEISQEVEVEGDAEKVIHNDVLDSPRTGRALTVDEVKPIYEINEKTGRTQIVKEFPAAAQAHGFNDIVDNYAGYATKTPLNNATLYQLEGSLNGLPGRFEWIIQDGQVTHRMFIQNGTMNGVPIKP